MKTTLIAVLLSLFTLCAAETCKYCGLYECQNTGLTLDLRSDGTAVWTGLQGRTWKEKKDTIELYTGATLEIVFKKEGQDLIRKDTGTRYLKVRDFE